MLTMGHLNSNPNPNPNSMVVISQLHMLNILCGVASQWIFCLFCSFCLQFSKQDYGFVKVFVSPEDVDT